MKKTNFIIYIFFLLLYGYPVDAQIVQSNMKTIPNVVKSEIDKGQSFYEYEVFNTEHLMKSGGEIDEALNNYTLLSLNVDDLRQVIAERKNTIRFNIPNAHGEPYELELVKADIFASDFTVRSSKGSELAMTGVHYRGIISGDYNSLVAVSFFEDEIMGFISNNDAQLVIGKLRGNTAEHIMYNDNDLKISFDVFCETMPEESVTYTAEDLTFSQPEGIFQDNCVNVYIEVDYDIFQDKGSNTTNYISGLFNQSATLYANDGITLSISEIFIWNSSHNYAGNCSREILEAFQTFRTTFNGDIGHLVSYDSNMGGIAAGFNALCNPDTSEKMCFSGINSSFSNVPLYSWSVMVFSHEMGHLLGSRHTHACVWNGTDTAIDGCGSCQEEPNPPPSPGGCVGSGLDCNFCVAPPIPSNGGTIMSYCHTQSVGINFNNGFGPQPSSVILNNIANAACLSPCCPVDITHNGTINSGDYEVSNSIVSTATIGSNQDVIYDAGNFISLEPVFLADASNGSTFFAVIDGCGGLYRVEQGESITDNTAENSVTFKNYPNPFTGQTTIEFTCRRCTRDTVCI